MSAALPFAIVFGAAATVAVIVITWWERAVGALTPLAERYGSRLDQAQIRIAPRDLAIAMLGIAAALWTVLLLLLRPAPLVAILLGPAAIGLVLNLTNLWIRSRIAKRRRRFNDQLELVLRLLSSALRAGLSMRQAMVLVVEESPEPTKTEFRRVVAQTNVGVGVNEALDALAMRMPSEELEMLVRAIRIQSKSGGNLGKILDHLATTIRERRKIDRKIRALTSEGRASGWVIGILPIAFFLFIFTTQPQLRAASLGTPLGQFALGLAATLEGLAVVSIAKIIRVNV